MENWTLTGECTRQNYPLDAPIWHGKDMELLNLTFNGTFDPSKIDTRYSGMWRYRHVLPIANESNIVSFNEGMTPIVLENWNDRAVYFKLDFLFPTGSYKDRGASVLLSKIKELGIEQIVEDSSGNAGCAIAAYARRAGVACEIIISSQTSARKKSQLAAYGADVTIVEGARDALADIAVEKAKNSYYASHAWNPYFFEGTKTYAYEIWEQLGANIPDTLVFPTGNGTLMLGAYLGFLELLNQKLIRKMPRFVAVQATHCAPLSSTFSGLVKPTVAEGIAVAKPKRINQLKRIISDTGGYVITVDEDEIEKTWKRLTARGYYVEKTTAAGVAGLDYLPKEGTILLPLTGHGLKIG